MVKRFLFEHHRFLMLPLLHAVGHGVNFLQMNVELTYAPLYCMMKSFKICLNCLYLLEHCFFMQGVAYLHNMIQSVLDKHLGMWEQYCLRHCFSVPEGFSLPKDVRFLFRGLCCVNLQVVT